MSSFVLKIIALLTMIIDHTGVIFQDKLLFLDYSALRVIGRISFVIYAFLIAEGCRHTKNNKKYLTRLIIFAILMHIGFFVAQTIGGSNIGSTTTLNIFFTLFLGAAAIMCYEKISLGENKTFLLMGKEFYVENKAYYPFIPLILACIISHIFHTDYSYYGVCLIFSSYYFVNKLSRFIVCSIILALLNKSSFVIYNWQSFFNNESYFSLLFFGAILGLVFTLLYNGKKGANISKWIFYISYPLHFIVLYLIYSYI